MAFFYKREVYALFYVVKRDAWDISRIVSVESVFLSVQKNQCLQDEHVLRACKGMPKMEGILQVN